MLIKLLATPKLDDAVRELNGEIATVQGQFGCKDALVQVLARFYPKGNSRPWISALLSLALPTRADANGAPETVSGYAHHAAIASSGQAAEGNGSARCGRKTDPNGARY